MKPRLKFLKSDAGVTAVEYGLIAALIAVVIIGALGVTGVNLGGVYNQWAAAVAAALGN